MLTPLDIATATMMKVEAQLLQTQLQLVGIETELSDMSIALDRAKKAGNGPLAQFLQDQIDELKDRKANLVDAYGRLRAAYTKLAGLLGHEVPDAIKNFDPNNIGIWA